MKPLKPPTRRDVLVFALLWLLFFGLVGGLAIWYPHALVGPAVFLLVAWIFSLLFNRQQRLQQLKGVLLPAVFGLTSLAATQGAGPAAAFVVWAIGGLGATLFAAAEELGSAAYQLWMAASEPIGWSVSQVVMGLVYYLVVTPIALVMRWGGRDPLARRLDPSATTYWFDCRSTKDRASYFRQF